MTAVPGSEPAPGTAEARRRRADWAMARLLQALRPHRERRLTARERRVEAAAALLFAVVAVVFLVAIPSDRAFEVGTAAALVAGYAVASHVAVHVGGGYTAPVQLILVPMLLWLPVNTVPAMVAAGFVAGALVDVVRGRAHPERLLTAVATAWYATGAAAVFLLAGEPDADDVAWATVAVALVAQAAVDLVASSAREWLGRGVPPALQLRVIAVIYGMDACLTPVAVVAAQRGTLHLSGLAVIVPLLAFIAALAADRRARLEELTSRVDELGAERRRSDAAIRRVGEAYGLGLDRPALLAQILRTAIDAVGAARGRARVGHESSEAGDAALDAALDAAEAAARRDRRQASATASGAVGMAQPLSAEGVADGTADVIAVARAGRAFTEQERALFGYLASQMAVAMENIALHERVRHEARTDELTGLANHRTFQELLALELERTRRFRRPVALAMIDIDHFKSVNDTYGHQQGDEVLRQVAQALRETGRVVDVRARYGGEELAVILPGTDMDGAVTAGEQIRRAVERLRVPRNDGGGALAVTVSVGVAATVPDGLDGAGLIAAADAALYEAKRGGRNRTVRAREAAVTGAGFGARFGRPGPGEDAGR